MFQPSWPDVNPKDILIQALGKDVYAKASESWVDPIVEISDDLFLENHRLFLVRGGRRLFDFQVLPGGSYSYWYANESTAWQLCADGGGIEALIKSNWSSFTLNPASKAASFLLMFSGGGIRRRHRVMQDVADLKLMENGRLTRGRPRDDQVQLSPRA